MNILFLMLGPVEMLATQVLTDYIEIEFYRGNIPVTRIEKMYKRILPVLSGACP